MTKKWCMTLFSLVVQSLLITASAQGLRWYFGDGAGVDFSSGSATPLSDGSSYSLDNSTAATDAQGNLLFYSNGMSVWDANHNVMPNGSGLLGSNNSGQCAMAVHWPGTNKFYLFTVDQWNGANGLRYSVVDMSLNGGLGDVAVVNQLLYAPNTERLEAVRNPNDGSWWLITHAWASDEFRTYNINGTGLNTVPVISAVGSVHDGGDPYGYNAAGQLAASPDGALVACGIYSDDTFEVFDFDATTGALSNARSLTGYNNAWGAAFSPNSTKLYLTKWMDDEVIQVDLSAGTWSDVQSSATLVGNTTGSQGSYQAGYLQLAADNLVYVAKFGQDNISRIEFPDLAGAACGFVDEGLDIAPGICNAGLCRSAILEDHVCSLNVSLLPISGCVGVNLMIEPTVANPQDGMIWSWDLGDSSSSNASQGVPHSYASAGEYFVQVIVSDTSGSCTDTAGAWVSILAAPLAGFLAQMSPCGSTVAFADASLATDSYLWDFGDGTTGTEPQPTHVFGQAGSYLVTLLATNACGVDTMSQIISVGALGSLVMQGPTLICDNAEVTFSVAISGGNVAQVLWSTGDTTSSILLSVSDDQILTATVTGGDGCTYEAELDVHVIGIDGGSAAYVPNVFSPNGDGLNETFAPVLSDPNSFVELLIFNRWGQVIYATSSITQPWNGRLDGEPVPDGTYVYIVRWKDRCTGVNKEEHGHVTLLR